MNGPLNQSTSPGNLWLVIKQSILHQARRFEFALLIGLVLIGPIMGFSYYSLRQLDGARKVQEHSLVVREHLNDLRAAVRHYEILYLREAPEETLGESRRGIDSVLNNLSQSVEADEIQTESLAEVRAAIAEFVTEPNPTYSKEVRDWILSMDTQEAEYLNEHRPASISFLATASGSILIVGILSLFLSILAFIGLRRQMRGREIIEAELRVAERQATRASEMKSKFLATISHEIRTPLNGIIAMADVMRGSELPQKEKRLTEVIFQSSQALLRIINDLLNFSQIEAGQVGLEVEIFSLRSLLEQTCSVLDLKAHQKNLQLRSIIAEDVPENVQGDGGRLGQVLFNLVGNAIKFTSSGTIDIKVARDLSSDQDVARINFSITDTGSGISAEDLETLFLPFNQLAQVGTSGEPGTGLGLSIAQSLVRQMGGEIRVESRVGHGSTFWFQLPLKTAPIGAQTAKAGEAAAAVGRSAVSADAALGASPALRFAGRHVLVAEDNPTNQIVAQTVLEQLGFRVMLAANGAEAVELTRDNHFDLVLMDCQMPELDGYEATRRIRAREARTGGASHVRIIAMTANAQADDRARCLAAGMDDYIAKPFVIEDLIHALSDGREARSEASSVPQNATGLGDKTADFSSIEKAMTSLRARLGENATERLRKSFLTSLEEWPLAGHGKAEDEIVLRDLSHKLKSSAQVMGAHHFAKRLETLELVLKRDLAERAPNLDIRNLKAELDEDVRQLKKLSFS